MYIYIYNYSPTTPSQAVPHRLVERDVVPSDKQDKQVYVHVHVYYIYICTYTCMSMYICPSMYVCVELSVLMVVVGHPHLHDCSNRPSIHPSTHPSIHSLLGTHLQKGLISDDFLTSSRAEMLQDKRIVGVMQGLWVLCIVFPTHQCQH